MTAVPALDEELCAAVMRLLDTVFRARGELTKDSTSRSAAVAHLAEQAQEVMDTAVARDRAAGASWSEIAEALDITFGTARRKYRARTSEALARFSGQSDGAPQPEASRTREQP